MRASFPSITLLPSVKGWIRAPGDPLDAGPGDDAVALPCGLAGRGPVDAGSRRRAADPPVRSARPGRPSTGLRIAHGPGRAGARVLPLGRLVTLLQGPARGAGESGRGAAWAWTGRGRLELRQRRHPEGLRHSPEDH